ncbi:hypothetical protein QQG55_7590 [Brugia pahangi]
MNWKQFETNTNTYFLPQSLFPNTNLLSVDSVSTENGLTKQSFLFGPQISLSNKIETNIYTRKHLGVLNILLRTEKTMNAK